MAFDDSRLAENIRRAAGAHLVTLDALARFVELSRPAMMKLVSRKQSGRSRPSGATAFKLAAAFGIDVRNLYEEPEKCLRAVVDAFADAPIRAIADVPEGGETPSSQFVLTSGDQSGLDGSLRPGPPCCAAGR